MSTVMQLCGDALGRATAQDLEYLKSMDFEAADGRGHLITTRDIAQAKRFDSLIEALQFAKTAPRCHPTRLSDGKPNRPLTAFNWTFLDPDRDAA